MPAIDVSEQDGVRYLHFGTHWIQGAMRIARPWSLELEYTREMMLPLLLRETAWPRSVLVIGLGAASITRFIYRHLPRAAQTVVERDAAVVDVARHFFRLPEARPRLAIEIGDGARYLAASERRFDWIVVDGYDARGRAGVLDALPFYADCRTHLTERGIATFNFLTWRQALRGSLDRLRHAFGAAQVLALPACESGNVVALAGAGVAPLGPLPPLRRAARRVRVASGLDLAPTLARIARVRSGKV
jgi:spermidine synthase